MYEGCASVALPSPPVVLSPRINYRVSVTADGSPTLPCSHRCILGERQVQPKVVCVCVCVCGMQGGTLTCGGMCLRLYTVIKLHSAVATLAIATNKQNNIPEVIIHALGDSHTNIF